MDNMNNKVDNQLKNMSEEKKQQILSDFEEFKSYLSEKVSKGEKLGMNEEMLAKSAEKVADYLAAHQEPQNSEENLLQQLWKVGDKDERHKLAHMLVKLVQ